MRLTVIIPLLTLFSPIEAAARWNRRQASSDGCTCPSTAPVTSACVDYTMVTSSTTVVAFGGVVTSTASDSISTVTISSLSTATVTTGTTILTLAGSTIFSTASLSTETTTRTITFYTSCSQVAYKHKRQASTTSVSQPTFTATPSTTRVNYTFTSDVIQSGTTRPVTCVCTPRPTSTTLGGTSSCNCPASTDVTIRFSSQVTATNFVFFTTTSYATVTSNPVVTVTSDGVTTQSILATEYTTLDFVELERPVTTVTETVSTTVISCPTPAQCNNQGIRWAAYNNTNAQGQNNVNSNPSAGNDNTYSSFDPTVFKTRTPVYVGNASTLGGFNIPQVAAQQIRIYNSSVTFTQNYLAVDHVGYLYAATSGTYKFTLAQADDLALLWVGGNARSGWTRANANLVDYYDKANAVYSFELFQGNYFPFRIFYANAQGASQFSASVTAPDGTVILNSNSRASPYLVQFSCGGTAAPPFIAFGAET